MLRSRMVYALRIILPLLALVLLSTLFLFADRPEPGGIPYAQIDADALDGPPRLRAPAMSTVTSGGDRIELRAGKATPGNMSGGLPASATFEGLSLRISPSRGPGVAMTAAQGMFGEPEVTLSGGVTITTDDGWTMRAPTVAANRATAEVTAPSGIEGTAPLGQISAGFARLHQEPVRGSILDLSGGVRLLYQP